MNVKFVSQKISRVRWEPLEPSSLRHADIFCTGSWDNATNRLSIWQLVPDEKDAAEKEPVLRCDAVLHGSIMDLTWIGSETIAVASSLGSVLLYRYDRDKETLAEITAFASVHRHRDVTAPATFVTSSEVGDVIVSGGEDGRLNVLDVRSGTVRRTIEHADSCTMNSGIFSKQSEVVTCNSIGQLKVWDVRANDETPTRMFSLTNDRTPVQCIDRHPHQPHILATGTQEGSLCIWDMRKDNFPVTIMEAHNAEMWDLSFHPTCPDNLFSCSEDGSVWHWNGSAVGSQISSYSTPGFSSDLSRKRVENNPWLASEASKHRIDITNLIPDNVMPVNSLSVQGSTLVCGSDGEAIFTIPNLPIR